MEAVECGAAVLGIVLAYYGRIVSLEELRVTCGVSRDGSTAVNILRAARRYGLIAKGGKAGLAALRRLSCPVIAHWNFNHFVVIEGFGRDSVFLNDPEQGHRTVSIDEFDRSYTGVVLTLSPAEDFRPGGRKSTLVPLLRQRLSGSWRMVLFIVLATLAGVIPSLGVPLATRVFVDQYLIGGAQEWIPPLLLVLAIASLLQAALTWLQRDRILRLETSMAMRESGHFFWHVLHLPIEFFTQRYAGDIGTRVSINDELAHLISTQMAVTIPSIVGIVVLPLVMVQYDATLALIGLFVGGLNFVALRLIARTRTEISRRLLVEQGKLVGASVAGIRGIETLKANGSEPQFFARWAGQQTVVANQRQKLAVATELLTVAPVLLSGVGAAAILLVGGIRVIDGYLTIGTLVAFQFLMTSFMTPVSQLVSLGTEIQEIEGNVNRLDDVLRYPVAPQAGQDEIDPGFDGVEKMQGRLEVRAVRFGYAPLGSALIEDFHLVLEPGERVALVGPTGSGKSTVGKLIAGLYQPWSGEVLFDGRPRTSIPPRLLARSLAMVDTESSLLAGTIKDNITLWNPEVTIDQIERAASDACIGEDIVQRPGAYDSPVSEGGHNLSGGQRQRLEIARALVHDPAILVLDEATSALDPVTEERVLTNVAKRGCTCLVIAHRLSAIRDSDRIAVMRAGHVVELGTHPELMQLGGTYAELIRTESELDPEQFAP